MPHPDINQVVGNIVSDVKSLTIQNTPNIQIIRRKYSRLLEKEDPKFLFKLAELLCKHNNYRGIAYELIQGHSEAFKRIDKKAVEALGRGINSWWTVDAFARTISGPAWLNRQISDKLIIEWAHSNNRWWRRAALVSTVALNIMSHGGIGDVRRTIRICRLLADDHDDTVVKAMSWALRALAVHDAESVRDFLEEYDNILASRMKREVNNKLKTGLKSPKRAM
jgi:3-methyladenine DNA glycosylase AlkD